MPTRKLEFYMNSAVIVGGLNKSSLYSAHWFSLIAETDLYHRERILCLAVIRSSTVVCECVLWAVCLHVCSPGSARRPSHQDSSGHFTPHVTNDQDMYEWGPSKKAAFWHDYPDPGENEIKCLMVQQADSTVDICVYPSSDVSAFNLETVMAVFA